MHARACRDDDDDDASTCRHRAGVCMHTHVLEIYKQVDTSFSMFI